jgi:hypothetical protein
MATSETAARKHDRGLLAIGALFAAGGLYFMLVGIGALPAPSTLYGPDWIALAVGVIFLAAGLSVLVRGWLNLPDSRAGLPDDAPAAAFAVQWLASLVIIAGLATIGTWIALGGGARSFTMLLPVKGTLGETAGRIAFGIGAAITWLLAAGVAAKGIRRILRKN